MTWGRWLAQATFAHCQVLAQQRLFGNALVELVAALRDHDEQFNRTERKLDDTEYAA
jgi:hypothetical protein